MVTHHTANVEAKRLKGSNPLASVIIIIFMLTLPVMSKETEIIYASPTTPIVVSIINEIGLVADTFTDVYVVAIKDNRYIVSDKHGVLGIYSANRFGITLTKAIEKYTIYGAERFF